MEQALEIFKEQLKGSVGIRLKQEFKIEPPEITFETIKCPAHDSECAVESALRFVQSDCVAVIGHTYSGPALAAGKVYDRNRMVLISPTASNPRVAQASNRVFSLTYDDEWLGAVIATYLYKILNRTRTGRRFEPTDYGRGLKDSFAQQAQFLGCQVGANTALPADSNDDEGFGHGLVTRFAGLS